MCAKASSLSVLWGFWIKKCKKKKKKKKLSKNVFLFKNQLQKTKPTDTQGPLDPGAPPTTFLGSPPRTQAKKKKEKNSPLPFIGGPLRGSLEGLIVGGPLLDPSWTPMDAGCRSESVSV